VKKEADKTETAGSIREQTAALEYTQFTTRYDVETNAIWCWLKPVPRPCMNVTLIDELILLQQQLTVTYKTQHPDTVWPFRHFILASKTPGVYNLGGDLEIMRHYIVNKDVDNLRTYAYKSIDLLHQNINNLDLPITMLSLVQGQALGAGFETALSCDVIIAERGSRMGFPEILFNLFPATGAYNLLARRVGSAITERIILSGKTYSAEELYDMGVIDMVVDDGDGIQATKDYLKSQNQSHNTIRSMKKIRQIVHPITRQHLDEIVEIWLDSAINLSEKDLAKMERLIHLQKDLKNSKDIETNNLNQNQRHGEWRKIKDVTFPLKTHLGEEVTQNRRKNDGCRREKPEPA
jgi:DSF synthase